MEGVEAGLSFARRLVVERKERGADLVDVPIEKKSARGTEKRVRG